MRSSIGILCVLIASSIVVDGHAQISSSETLEKGVALFLENRLEEALPLIEEASSSEPRDAAPYAWAAETLRRLGRYDEAVDRANRALAIDSCQSMAHQVLGDLYNPQFGALDDPAGADRCCEEYMAAVRCDPSDGNPWLSVWTEAMHRGDTEWERRALQALDRTSFFTPAILAYNRWMLRDLPPNAILLTNGDMDTYPARVLQEVARFRTDVAVVNVSLLNTTWYQEWLAEHNDLPLPETPLDVQQEADGGVVLINAQLIRWWLQQQLLGGLQRPLAVSTTVSDLDLLPDETARFQLKGAFYECLREHPGLAADTVAVRRSLRDVNPDDYAGPFASAQDRSPIRQVYSSGLLGNIVVAALETADDLREAGLRRPAAAWLVEADRLAAELPGQKELFAYRIQAAKKALQQER